jgi:predicted ester cyclase
MAQTEKQLVLRFVDEVANGANLDAVDALVHGDFFSHEAAASRGSGPLAVRATILQLHQAFSGFRVECLDLIAENGKVALRTRVSGRHVGEFNGIPPSWHEWSVQQIHIVRVVDGKLIEHWASRDDLGALRQLGVLPEPTLLGSIGGPLAPVGAHTSVSAARQPEETHS